MPPIMESGSPLPLEVFGNGNQPRSGSGFWSGVRDAITPGSQAPISSIAALWFASRPAELPAPCRAEVVRNPALNGCVLLNASRSSPAFVQQLSSNFSDLADFSSVDSLHSRRAKL